MHSLSSIYNKFLKRSSIIQSRAQYIQGLIPSLDAWRYRHLTEGLISDLWQMWCNICRSIILCSCQGAIARDGHSIPARTANNCWQRIGYEGKCAAGGATKIKPKKQLVYKRHEPTWGDQDRIIDIIIAVNPSNTATLLSAFGLPVCGPKHLQTVRNACSHKDSETLNSVRDLAIRYIASTLHSPYELAWFIDRKKKCCAIYSWCDDLSLIVEVATKQR